MNVRGLAPTGAGVREIVVVSGKGGTGKTSITACFAALARDAVLADCDVDAANFHILLEPRVLRRHDFWSGEEATIDASSCDGCGLCADACRFDAIRAPELGGASHYEIDPMACEGCGVCRRICPRGAITLSPRLSGEWMESETRLGPLIHARLGAGGESSGRLVSVIRNEARALAEARAAALILADGPPGIGCPVIASVTGADLVMVVTEPTVSGAHDLERVLALARHFALPAAVCVNKWDINPEMTERIEEAARIAGATVVGRVAYDASVTRAQRQCRAVVETDSPLTSDISAMWERVSALCAAGTRARGIGLPVRASAGATDHARRAAHEAAMATRVSKEKEA